MNIMLILVFVVVLLWVHEPPVCVGSGFTHGILHLIIVKVEDGGTNGGTSNGGIGDRIGKSVDVFCLPSHILIISFLFSSGSNGSTGHRLERAAKCEGDHGSGMARSLA